MNDAKFFPIRSDTACLLKWGWSTIFLGQGTSSSCHRTDQAPIPPNDMASFHNLPNKIRAREMMRRGEWPQEGCQYCEKIERAGGKSDRIYQLENGNDQILTPPELLVDPAANAVTPTTLEIYFTNVCNMACLYCGSHFSSMWEEENRRFGEFQKGPIAFGYNRPHNPNYQAMLEQFWQYLGQDDRYQHIKQFQIAGGEPFFQPELEQCLAFWEAHPNPDLTFNFITNLKVPHQRFRDTIDRIGRMVDQGRLQRLQISSSLDCWGPQQEYVRHGLSIKQWQDNFEYLLDKPFVQQVINAAITPLTIKTLPDLIERWQAWNQRCQDKVIYFSFMTVMAPPWMDPAIFGAGVFDEDFDRVLALMPESDHYAINLREHMAGIAQQIRQSPRDVNMITGLIDYLDEIDRRRDTNWRLLFPWLDRDWSSR